MAYVYGLESNQPNGILVEGARPTQHGEAFSGVLAQRLLETGYAALPASCLRHRGKVKRSECTMVCVGPRRTPNRPNTIAGRQPHVGCHEYSVPGDMIHFGRCNQKSTGIDEANGDSTPHHRARPLVSCHPLGLSCARIYCGRQDYAHCRFQMRP